MTDGIAQKSIEASFADWEGNAFGMGYGTGEPHTIPAIRKFFTHCKHHSGTAYQYEELESDLGAPVAWLLINSLYHADCIEYGTSPRYGWLTPQGAALQKFMLSRTDDELIRIACAGEEVGETCYPNACNCGPQGYVKGRICVNPFWQKDAAQAFLSLQAPTDKDKEQ